MRAGVEDLGADRLRDVQATDDVAGFRRVRIMRRGHHHAQCGLRVPARVDRVQTMVDGGFDQIQQIRIQPQHHRLGFGVAETHVELDHFRGAVGVDHQPGVEETGERHAVGGHAAHGGFHHFAHDPRMYLGRDYRRG